MNHKYLLNSLFFTLIIALTISFSNAQESETCKVESISMNKICKDWDGQWQGIIVASDGNCYFGTSTHSRSHGAGFHKNSNITHIKNNK